MKEPEIKDSQLTDGINLSKKEFTSVATVVKALAKVFGEGTYDDSTKLVNEFKSQMRQTFDIHITFEELKVKENAPTNMKVVACRFKKDRPLIFLAMETENKNWFILDEKRFPALEAGSPFEGVNI